MRDLKTVLLVGSEEGENMKVTIDTDEAPKRRDYSCVSEAVVSHYRALRSQQTHDHVKSMHANFHGRERRPLQIWRALEIM